MLSNFKGKISTKRSNANDSMLMSSFLTSSSEFEVGVEVWSYNEFNEK